ncbi:insulin-like growth factor-binding protein 2 [Otolemur garnettii]|uniref:insulin-like growth factor-binding protein 2 n=1 Tax=Otolemur garnettii TaxID=30611 RepID=UPI000C7ECB17|nr:insulin-like growth factor-binding protein 2 [Otolemur garnettii]
MLPRLGGPALPLLLSPLLLLLGVGGGGLGARAEVLFRCPLCTPERLAVCGPPPAAPPAAVAGAATGARAPCAELVREPGCGCCSVCARMEGEACGVYTPRCAQGLRCYPDPDSELPLQALVMGEGTCEKRRDAEYGASPEQVAGKAGWTASWEKLGGQRRSLAGCRWVAKECAAGPQGLFLHPVSRSLQTMLFFFLGLSCYWPSPSQGAALVLGGLLLTPSVLCACLFSQTPCQQELDQVLERISTMRLPDERGPLEHLYSLHIPNCDKHGLYNLKQCKMSLNGQRGECWCVNPNTGKLIQGAPTIRGDPECHLFYNEQQEARGVHTQRVQ